MKYSFKDTYSKETVAVETDKYVIYQTLKSNLYYSGNYLLIKSLPATTDELDYYIEAYKNFFRDKNVNFVHLAISENIVLPNKLKKYLIKLGFNEIKLDLYVLNIDNFIEKNISNFNIELLKKSDYSKFLEFNYKIDLELANSEWAEHNQKRLYEDIRSEQINQIVAKDDEKIIGVVNIIVKDTYFEIDALYVDKNYRNKGIAKHLITYAIKNFNKKNVILVADSYDTAKYMYENMGFEKISEQYFYLNTK